MLFTKLQECRSPAGYRYLNDRVVTDAPRALEIAEGDSAVNPANSIAIGIINQSSQALATKASLPSEIRSGTIARSCLPDRVMIARRNPLPEVGLLEMFLSD